MLLWKVIALSIASPFQVEWLLHVCVRPLLHKCSTAMPCSDTNLSLPAHVNSKSWESGKSDSRWELSPYISDRYVPFKILKRLIYTCVKPIINLLILQEQAGFWHGRSTAGQVTLLTQDIEDCFSTKKAGAEFVISQQPMTLCGIAGSPASCCNYYLTSVFPLRCATVQYHLTICAVLSHSSALPTF